MTSVGRWLLALTIGILWLGATIYAVRSCFVNDTRQWNRSNGRHYELTSIPGYYRFTVASHWTDSPYNPVLGRRLMHLNPYAFGFGYEEGSTRLPVMYHGFDTHPTPAVRAVTYCTFSIPMAVPMLLLFLIPASAVFAARRRRLRRKDRLARGLCPSCGYDLRASPQQCPECGAAITHAA